jgi:hypothetical protein
VLNKVCVGCGKCVDDVQRDEDTQCAAKVKSAKGDGAGGDEFAAQKRGDEVSGEEEEDGNAERSRNVIRDSRE